MHPVFVCGGGHDENNYSNGNCDNFAKNYDKRKLRSQKKYLASQFPDKMNFKAASRSSEALHTANLA